MEDGGIFEESVNLGGGGSTEDVEFEGGRRAANERERHHGVAEMVEFDDEQAGFHGKISHGGTALTALSKAHTGSSAVVVVSL